MLKARKRSDSKKFVASEIIFLLICVYLFNFQQLVNAACISLDGNWGECVRFEECRSAVILSRKGITPGFCSLEEGTVCCTDYRSTVQQERTPYKEVQSNQFQRWPSNPGPTNTNTKDPFEEDANIQRKKYTSTKPVGNNNYGKKKTNSEIIEEPYKYETPGYNPETEVTYKPVRRPGRPNSQEGNFVPPGQAKKKPWRDEKTTENDYYYEHVAKKPSRGPSRKGSNKRPGNNNESNNSRKWTESGTEWSEQGGKGSTSYSYNNQNAYENDYSYKRTTPRRDNWEQGTYTSTRRPDYYGGGSGDNYAGNGDTYPGVKPTRRPQSPSSTNVNINRPTNQGNNFPSYQQGSSSGGNRPTNQGNNFPNYQQGSSSGGNRPTNQGNNFPNYQQGSSSGGNRPTNQGNNFPNYQQGSSSGGNRPSSRPDTQKRKSISEQKCEEYSKQVIENITGLPLTTNPDPVTIPVRKCITPQQLIVGGENTTLGEFPHMAAIGFRDRNKKQISWNCGGTLISEQFVMTAGHCTSTSSGRPVKVRLGEYNLIKNDDGAYPVDYAVVEIITHPEYRPPSKYNDIALLKLSRKVTFFKHIRPACLYSQEMLSSSKAIATGWGRIHYDGGTSEILQKVVLSIVDNNICDRFYKVNVKTEVLSRGIIDSQLCAGELTGGKDTCQGDSGGPLSITSTKCIHHVIGITSFGKSCALPNSTGVYTRVSFYVPWIESVVWPTSYD